MDAFSTFLISISKVSELYGTHKILFYIGYKSITYFKLNNFHVCFRKKEYTAMCKIRKVL